ncbi:MAG: GPP34 family phosphoprotein [Lachnospiraceae bacterium]|nr:GPP34 family phosphoprotein [Lachnospiraceae bacterium]
MKNLSLTQQYLLCVLNKNGKLPAFGLEKTLCLSAASVLELLMEDALSFDGKKLTVQSPLPKEKTYLRPVYQVVERKQPVKFESIVEYFSLALTDKHMNELIDSIGTSLVQNGCVQREETGGLFGGRNVYIPNEVDVDSVVQSIRAELLEDGELSEDVVALTMLLHKSGDLQKYFSAYEKKDLKKRLKEIKNNPQNKMIQKAVEYVDSLLCLVIVAIS